MAGVHESDKLKEIPQARLCHLTAQRVRIRIPSRRGDVNFFIRLSAALEGCPGAQAITTNASTGSVVLVSLGGIALDEVQAYAEEKGLFRLMPPGTMMQSIVENIRRVDDGMRALAGNEVDLASVGFVTLAGMGLYQLARGQVAAPAVSVLWYAASILMISARRPPEGS